MLRQIQVEQQYRGFTPMELWENFTEEVNTLMLLFVENELTPQRSGRTVGSILSFTSFYL